MVLPLVCAAVQAAHPIHTYARSGAALVSIATSMRMISKWTYGVLPNWIFPARPLECRLAWSAFDTRLQELVMQAPDSVPATRMTAWQTDSAWRRGRRRSRRTGCGDFLGAERRWSSPRLSGRGRRALRTIVVRRRRDHGAHRPGDSCLHRLLCRRGLLPGGDEAACAQTPPCCLRCSLWPRRLRRHVLRRDPDVGGERWWTAPVDRPDQLDRNPHCRRGSARRTDREPGARRPIAPERFRPANAAPLAVPPRLG